MKKIQDLHELVKNSEFTEKVRLFFSTKERGDDYDTYEKTYEYTNLNPITIRCLVRTISMNNLIWKQYGLSETGAVELITESKYENWFRQCVKIVIKDKEYSVYKEPSGSRSMISILPNKTLKVILSIL